MTDKNFAGSGQSIEQYAKVVFGSSILANKWLALHNEILGTSPNIAMLSQYGEREVRRILVSIEHGLPV